MTTHDNDAFKPIATVDLAIFSLSPTGLSVLLVRRTSAPFSGDWALPGGWIHIDEDADLEAAARRVLKEKTGVETPYLEQLQTTGNRDRDPRGWSISIVYIALISADDVAEPQGAVAEDAEWRPIEGDGVGFPIAFDHASLLQEALGRIRSKVEYSSLPGHLLPVRFTLSELQSVYESLLGRKLDKSAFRKRMAEADFLEPVEGEMRRASNRPAQVFRLKDIRSLMLFDRRI
ncbi:probable DNA hydrolase protein, MutT/nudix protein family (plasmid) [Rhizobium etli CFN 42]|uniref:NUDIX hydrolase domain-containing protein n=2 Tax=Rhizobium etli TaxID=29449 RepID=A0AAN1BLY6_RHIET|nr:NUDIX domain-containing protein [Rhizobium etli]ABC93921.1 probable DNA hydrolase protein, MutT/nudix protein family [Rhizobium etli CFN 42]AGS25701.1 NUDIX hydrolase domain-containing protein [Rhizobium etli bv. mimosae str. Mim1]ARQ13629.1 NUDIX hydrolase domain-containing protein [Rhizobium etli]